MKKVDLNCILCSEMLEVMVLDGISTFNFDKCEKCAINHMFVTLGLAFVFMLFLW